jgi:hypothetical protein
MLDSKIMYGSGGIIAGFYQKVAQSLQNVRIGL